MKEIQLKGVAMEQGVTRDQQVLAYLIGESGSVIVCASAEGDVVGLAQR